MFSTAVYNRASEEMPVCNESNIIEYSDLCLNEDPPQDCYPSLESTPHVTALSLIFHSFNIFLGLAGNLLTLLSIPYARYRRRFGFQRINDSPTLYILNLAFCDFLFCLVPAPMFALHLVYRGWPFGKTMCVVSAILRWAITIVDYLSLSLIAFSRFFMLSHPRVGKVVFTGRLAQLPLAGMWILGIIAISPFLFAGDLGDFGYDCQVGHCSMMKTETVCPIPRLFIFAIGFLLPFLTIVLSNIGLWKIVRSSSTYLKDDSDHMNRQLSARDHRMARTICTICLGYLFCNVPVIVIKLVRGNDTDDIPYVRLVASCLYFMQYSLNFVVYAGSNKQYREAYLLYLREAVFCLDKETAATSSANRAAFPLTSLRKSGRSKRSSSQCSDQRRHITRCFKREDSGGIGKCEQILSASVSVHNSAPCPVNFDHTSPNSNAYPCASI